MLRVLVDIQQARNPNNTFILEDAFHCSILQRWSGDFASENPELDRVLDWRIIVVVVFDCTTVDVSHEQAEGIAVRLFVDG